MTCRCLVVMNDKKGFQERNFQTDRGNKRNVLRDVKEFVTNCGTVGRNEKLDQEKKMREISKNKFAYVGVGTGQCNVNEERDGATSNILEVGSFNFNATNFSNNRTNFETKLEKECFGSGEKSLFKEKSESEESSPVKNSSKKLRHLPFKTTLLQVKKTGPKKLENIKTEEIINSGHGSKNIVENNSSSMSLKRVSSGLTKKKQNPIILPREQFEVLQERIKTEIENLKYLENAVSCEDADSKSNESREKKSKSDDEDEYDELDELGSDIQFLSPEERNKLLLKYSKKLDCDVKDESKLLKTKVNTILSSESVKSDVGILTIDLTKEPTPSDVTEKTEAVLETDYPSLDLDYDSKIDWEDGKKSTEMKHSNVTSEKAIVNLDIDQSKLTFETTKKITDIKNRLSRSLSIGLSHKELEKNASTKNKMDQNVISISHGSENEESVEDAEVLELASLRCTSERTEVIADRERRRKRRCADYPGLAFGFSIFSSDTMMKFNIIKNELHNIMNTQLKRVCTDLIFYNFFFFFSQ